MSKVVFVTVGTTQFDNLIHSVTRPDICKIGKCEFEPSIGETDVEVEYYRYKPSLEGDISQASLVISHAGAGSCLEALCANKALLVVINDELMDNHQLELANQLKKDGHIEYCTCSSLLETLQTCDFTKLKPFSPGEPQKFASFLDSVLGYS